MLAMDIVDTLRHRELVVEKELGGAVRKDALVTRLKEIYAAQGIEVSERIIEDGVSALEERRFAYDPPKDSFLIRLARIYVRRDRWMKPLAFVTGLALFATAAYEFGFDNPREARAERERIELAVELPEELAAAYSAALSLAASDGARARIETSYLDGVAAADSKDAEAARKAIEELEFLSRVLAQDLAIRIVSRPGEMSGVWRIPNDTPSARNYYLIVEAVDAKGRAHAIEIESEEDRKTARAGTWGVRVSEEVFNEVAADKADDQIIVDNMVGTKPHGEVSPTYEIATAGGEILEW